MKKRYKQCATGAQQEAGKRKMSVLRFGKPEPVLTTGTDYRDVWYDNDYDHYSLPIDRLALAQLINLNGHSASYRICDLKPLENAARHHARSLSGAGYVRALCRCPGGM